MSVEATQRVPGLLVERLAAGELSAQEAAVVRERLEAEPGGMERLAMVAQSDEEILRMYPVADMVRQIEQRAENLARVEAAAAEQEQARLPKWLTFGMPAAVAALAVILVLRPGAEIETSDPGAMMAADEALLGDEGEGNRAKGLRAHLQVFRKRGEDAERLRDGQAASSGDVLQLRYVAGDAAHGVIVSIDGRGEVTQHFPEEGDEATELKPGRAIALPHAYELDDAPRFERFVMVTSNSKIDIEVILRAARSTAALGDGASKKKLDLPDGIQQFSFLVQKVQP